METQPRTVLQLAQSVEDVKGDFFFPSPEPRCPDFPANDTVTHFIVCRLRPEEASAACLDAIFTARSTLWKMWAVLTVEEYT